MIENYAIGFFPATTSLILNFADTLFYRLKEGLLQGRIQKLVS